MLATAEAGAGVLPRLRRAVLPRPDGLGRRLAYALVGLPLGVVYAALFGGVVAAAILAVYGIGVLIAVLVLMLARGFGGWERALVRGLLDTPLDDCARVRAEPGVVRRLRLLLVSGSTWRTLAWLGVRVLVAAASATALFLAAGLGYLLLTYPTSFEVGRSLGLDLLVLALVVLTAIAAVRVLDLLSRLLALIAPRLLDASAEQRIAALRQASVRLAERTSVARDLHDTIGHTLTASLLQAGAARRALAASADDAERPADLAFARQALGHIEDTTRQALAELDRALAVLGDPSRAGRLAEPPPDLGDVDGLLAGLRDAGLPLEVSVATDDLPPEVSRLAYRVVQEGTTNVLRHAGLVPTRVEVAVGEGRAVVRVRNEPGSRGPGRPGPGGGRGLPGLAARAAELGGRVASGPTPEGGFELVADLPVRGARG